MKWPFSPRCVWGQYSTELTAELDKDNLRAQDGQMHDSSVKFRAWRGHTDAFVLSTLWRCNVSWIRIKFLCIDTVRGGLTLLRAADDCGTKLRGHLSDLEKVRRRLSGTEGGTFRIQSVWRGRIRGYARTNNIDWRSRLECQKGRWWVLTELMRQHEEVSRQQPALRL